MPALAAVITGRTALVYADGAEAALDRPAHVRAASSIAATREGFAVVQDDANFIAIVDQSGRVVRSIALPAGPGGLRQFDDLRGNKADKLDLECCVSLDEPDGTLLMAFGSGSTPKREHVVVIRYCESDQPDIAVVPLPAFYDQLKNEEAFAGSELNIEGAVHLGGRLRLFGRGNGAARRGIDPANATCDIDWQQLLEHIRAPVRTPPPRPQHVAPYELGALDGIALGFTDATMLNDALLYSATAEDSPDVTRDGRVAGSVIGVLRDAGRVQSAPIIETSGAPFLGKVEGLVTVHGSTARLHVVVDSDDPATPSDLCSVELRGDWGVV